MLPAQGECSNWRTSWMSDRRASASQGISFVSWGVCRPLVRATYYYEVGRMLTDCGRWQDPLLVTLFGRAGDSFRLWWGEPGSLYGEMALYRHQNAWQAKQSAWVSGFLWGGVECWHRQWILSGMVTKCLWNRQPLHQEARKLNNKSCRDLQQFAWEKLLRLNCVRRVGGPSKVELPLSVVYSNKLGLLVGGGWKPLHESVCDCTAVFDTWIFINAWLYGMPDGDSRNFRNWWADHLSILFGGELRWIVVSELSPGNGVRHQSYIGTEGISISQV